MAHAEQEELYLYAANEAKLYPLRQAIEANLNKKWAKGAYDERLAPKAFTYFVEEAAKRYVREFAPGSSWHAMFSVGDRMEVAKRFAEEYQDEAKANPPKPSATHQRRVERQARQAQVESLKANIGKRVELHPGTDWWMRGARYGDVVGVTRDGMYRVKLDRAGTVKLGPDNIGKWL